MNAIPDLGTLVDTPLAQAIGWALLQFVWQGALIGVAAALGLAALRKFGADIRYVVATISMSLMLTVPIVSVIQEWDRRTANSTSGIAAIETPRASEQAVRTSAAAYMDRTGAGARTSARVSPLPPAIDGTPPVAASARLTAGLLIAWAIGVLLLSIRLLSGWICVQGLRIHATPADASLCEIAEQLAHRLHVTRAVRLVSSAAIEVPTVMGWLKPVVLLPASALAGLSPAQLEAVLAHELAHVRRHDYLVNLLQTAVETLLFYHPAVWWISRQIRIERENCCDDLAVSLCGDRVLYAQTLADLEQLRGAADRLALAANGGSLVHRVRRLLGAPSHAGTTPGWLAVAVAVAVVVSVAGIAGRAMDRQTGPSVEHETTRQNAASTPAPNPPLRKRELLQWRAPGTFERVLRDSARQFSRALQQSHRALNAAFRDLFPQVPPLPPLPPEPPEPALPAPPSELPVASEPPEPPAFAEPPDVALPPAPPPFAELPPPPAVAVPPVPPASPGLPVPPIAGVSRSQKSGNFVHSNDGEKLEVNYRGDIEFTDDDADVKSLTPDGWLRIKESGRNGTHAAEFRSDASGKIERRFWVGGTERPFDPEGRKWLAQILPRFIRQSGIGAEPRVRRIYRTKGAQGVLGEIAMIEGSWAKRIYFAELLKTPGLDARAVQQALAQAGREVESDFELASLLISTGHLLTDDATRKTYIDAAGTIDSDFEMRRVYSSAVKGGQLAPPVLTALLDSSTAIGSDFELASLLIDVAKAQTLDDTVRTSFFKAVATIDSDFEQRRVLSAISARTDLSPAMQVALLESATNVGSDFELATVLLEFVRDRSIEGTVREPFFRAVDSIQSDFERGRVLQAASKRGEASDQTILDIIRSAGKMNSHFEAARVLLAVAGVHPLSRDARDAYVDAAGRLGEHEQGRVLSALVKNERRK